ncbi:TonB-dependent receptor domain-containing protein [Rhodohalobacter sulfatireducens]|uniref:TonB dependent receptor n=1 Tax=Rhodohalobacter sulfatireducens TaxID=2911366 RepID=A0ABS9KFF1_9BACT|nr:TonB-dependent receptor [Rhodohalobacter sulfatireducens]MCG2589568.1 TonB dependent receptor [Rhodohalobacter sulfatireducens]
MRVNTFKLNEAFFGYFSYPQKSIDAFITPKTSWPDKTKILSLFFCALAMFACNSQVQGQNTLKGIVTDTNHSPLPSATVLLLNSSDSTLVKGGITDDAGVYQIDGISPGTYLLSVTMLGFQKYDTEPLKITQADIEAPPIRLQESIDQLDEISVTARRPMFEQETDRLVFNVQQHISSSGNSALELLQKTPGVIVNRQNNSISMSARGEVLLMINNKIQRIPAAVLMARLQGMQAENVERIEVIHQPSAKYDASGSAGIIHIVLKQNNQQGTNGNLSLTGGYGQKEKAGASLNLNSRKGSLNWYGDYTYNRNRSDDYEINHYREYDYLGDFYNHQNFLTLQDFHTEQHTGNLGLDINFNNGTILGFLFGGSISDQILGSGAESESMSFVNNERTSISEYIFGTATDMSSLTGNANLFQKLSDDSHINLDFDYAAIRYDNFGDLQSNQNLNEMIEYDRTTPMKFWITSLDYVNRLSSSLSLETGVKGTFNRTDNATDIHSLSGGYWSESDLFASEEKINEQILAGYLSLDAELSDKLSAEAGVRYEHYTYLLNSEGREDIEHNFSNPFPILRFNYEVNSENSIHLGYNRSITRPAFFSLTSFFLIADPSLIGFANPQLRPTFTNNFRVSWQRKSAIFSLAYLDRTNQIYFYNTVDKENHLQTSSPTNLDLENIYEANLSVPLFPADWWEMSLNLSGFYHQVKDESSRIVEFKDKIFTYSAQISNTILLGNDWSVGMDGMYRSHFLQGDQVQYVAPYLNIGLNKKFQSGSSLSISLQDVANSMGVVDWEYHQPSLGIKTFGDNNFSERQVRITFTLLFGNQKLTERRKRETGASEVKERI